MRAGSLDRRITIQRKSATTGTAGQVTETWSALAANRWAAVKPMTGDERFAVAQLGAKQQTEFRVRWSADVADLTPLDRIVYPVGSSDDTGIYDIAAVHEIGRREGLQIIAVRRTDT